MNKGGSAFLRARNRSVGILLTMPPIPSGCYAPNIKPSDKEIIEKLKKVIEDPKAVAVLGIKGKEFMNELIGLLIKGGNVDYISAKLIKDSVDRWLREYRPLYKKIDAMSPQEREKLGKTYNMEKYPSVSSEQIKWKSLLTNKIIQQTKPEVFIVYALNFLDTMRKLVIEKCGDVDLIWAVLPTHIQQIRGGINAVHNFRDFQHAIAEGIGGLSALDNFFEIGARNWITKKAETPNTLYSSYYKVYGKPVK
jgi:hypothetical protein